MMKLSHLDENSSTSPIEQGSTELDCELLMSLTFYSYSLLSVFGKGIQIQAIKSNDFRNPL
jgi:hypothetical protein